MSEIDRIRRIALVATEKNQGAWDSLIATAEQVPVDHVSVDQGPVDQRSAFTQARSATVSAQGITVHLMMWTPQALIESITDDAHDLLDVLEDVNGAVFALSATGGIPDVVIEAWDACDDVGLPRAVVITGIDAPTATTEIAIELCQEALGDLVPVLAVQLPVLSDEEIPVGLIDVLTGEITDYSTPTPMKMPGEQQHRDLIADEHAWLVDAIMSETLNEALVAQYLSREEIDPNVLLEEFYAAVERGRLHPLFLTASQPPGLGVDAIWDLFVHGFCSASGPVP